MSHVHQQHHKIWAGFINCTVVTVVTVSPRLAIQDHKGNFNILIYFDIFWIFDLFQTPREFAGVCRVVNELGRPQSLILHTSILSTFQPLHCHKAPRPELARRTANPEFTIRRLDVFKVTRIRWRSAVIRIQVRTVIDIISSRISRMFFLHVSCESCCRFI